MKIIYSKGAIAPDEVLKHLSFMGQAFPLYEEIVKNKGLLRKARELQLEASEDQLQGFADKFRTVRGLLSSEDIVRFLKAQGLTIEDFEEFCELSVLKLMMTDRLAEERKMKDYFVTHRSQYDRARISQIVVKEEQLANEIKLQVTEEGQDFHRLARKYSLDEATKYAGGYLGFITREMLSPEIVAKIFSAAPGDLLGPFPVNKQYLLFLVEELVHAEFSEEVRSAIKAMIYEEWASQFVAEDIRVEQT